jgi:hypothetical protein
LHNSVSPSAQQCNFLTAPDFLNAAQSSTNGTIDTNRSRRRMVTSLEPGPAGSSSSSAGGGASALTKRGKKIAAPSWSVARACRGLRVSRIWSWGFPQGFKSFKGLVLGPSAGLKALQLGLSAGV